MSNNSIDYFFHISDIPVTSEHAMQSDDSHNWQHAMENAIEALNDSCTYELVSKPFNDVIGSRWVYCTKINEDGKEIFRARYVAKEFKQVSGIDYGETFPPTAKLTSVRTLKISEDLDIFTVFCYQNFEKSCKQTLTILYNVQLIFLFNVLN